MPAYVVTIPILDDLIVEDNNSFHVTLTTFDTAATLRLQTTRVTIRDNDSKLHCNCIHISCCLKVSTCFSYKHYFLLILEVTIGFKIAEYSVNEDVGIVSANVSVLNGTLARDVSVRVFTSDDTATSEGEWDLVHTSSHLPTEKFCGVGSTYHSQKSLHKMNEAEPVF